MFVSLVGSLGLAAAGSDVYGLPPLEHTAGAVSAVSAVSPPSPYYAGAGVPGDQYTSSPPGYTGAGSPATFHNKSLSPTRHRNKTRSTAGKR